MLNYKQNLNTLTLLKTFQVLPHRPENHAPDLREKKEEIEELYTEFDSLRDGFYEDFDGGIVNETENFTLELVGYFSR